MKDNYKALALFIKAAKKFIGKVERGEARSVETYKDLKEALSYVEENKEDD